MCGIAGLILDEPDPRGTDWVTAMTQRLYHRGPDDGGAVVFGPGGSPVVQRRLGRVDEPVAWGPVPVRVALGARRLAVIDVSPAGRQPMSSPDRRVWLAFNGEVYNHETLRSELSARGMAFSGRSDTEVFLAAMRAWGCDCFRRLEGMWGAAFVDHRAGHVVLSRDRLGIKPLYVARFDGGLAFASEIKALLLLPGAGGGVNEARLRDFLAQGLVDHTDETLFEGIWSVPPGCWIVLNLRGRGSLRERGTVQRYWRPQPGWVEPPDAPGQVRSALREAVRSHLRSDVPVGSCLSGGLDSSAIVALVHDLAAEDARAVENWTQHAFTASLPGSPLDETRYAALVTGACAGLESRQVTPTAEGLHRDMESLMWHQEQPFGSPSIYMQWEVMRLARAAGVTVLLDGQGGDELFCGYEGYLPPFLAHLLLRGRLFRLAGAFRAAVRDHFRPLSLTGHLCANLLPRNAQARLRRRLHAARQPWLDRELFTAARAPGLCRGLGLRPAEDENDLPADTTLSRHLWAVLLHDSLPSLLRFEDRSAMAFSIEARVPLLDRAVVELAMALPPSLKIRHGRLKAVLREAMNGLVPDAILQRRDKIGFEAPTAAWMRGALGAWWRPLLASKPFRERGCFNEAGVHSLTARFDKGDDAAALPLWRLAIVEQWARQFLDGG